ncbi:MAG TPA: transposase [Spirochaetia bacterium]|nr:transposase [Spirochaetales bacterium]HOT58134.1 transposase [Spirochaetales bacterium]HPD80809.1 transposase [Spirochaetales bacterium]HQK33213.1 transposase [Spirochaetales bacterium]HRS65851.1 transposase [Spirochaetia bacterium]
MPRKPRLLIPGATYHITARTNYQTYFLQRSGLKKMFMKILKKLQKEYQFNVEGFTLMDNHIHLLIKPRDCKELPKIMQRLLVTFAKKFNAINDLVGHFWAGRYFSEPLMRIQDVERVLKYIILNPVKAKMVKRPDEWFWSGLLFFKKGFKIFLNWISDEIKNLYEKFSQENYDFSSVIAT